MEKNTYVGIFVFSDEDAVTKNVHLISKHNQIVYFIQKLNRDGVLCDGLRTDPHANAGSHWQDLHGGTRSPFQDTKSISIRDIPFNVKRGKLKFHLFDSMSSSSMN